MTGRRALQWLAPAVVLTAGACFATREDVRVLQLDLQVVRAERVAADSALLLAIESGLLRVSRALADVADTARAANATVMRLRGDVREDLQSIRQQLIMIQELTGQSQRRIQELRSEMEARAAELATPVVPPAGDPATGGTAMAPARPAPAVLGPAQLMQMGQDQLRRGSTTAARGAFLELLDKHPTSDLAPDALYSVAETWADEGNGVAADSVYALVAQRYPRSAMAPNALYKRATAFRSIGQAQQARAIYQQIVDRYPRSDAALLAQEFLRASP
ncbi:MAG: tetratricopeptide repeat protein [Gemmatimonadaceae bacterium]